MSASQKMFVVGVDVSKAHLDVATRKKNSIVHQRVANTRDGVMRILALVKKRPSLVVAEATGPYSALLHEVLSTEGVSVAIVNPKRVRDFLRGLGRQAKTDAIDAAGLLRFGETADVTATPLASVALRELRALVLRRKQVQEELRRCLNHREAASPVLDQSTFTTIEEACKVTLVAVEKRIDELMKGPDVKELAEMLQAQKGVGPVVASTLIAELPELGQLNRKEVASLTGLAPYSNDSGTLSRRRFIRGGRAAPRAALYMAALVASRHDPVISAFCRRLVANGKTKKQAIVAAARKLLTWLNARAKALISQQSVPLSAQAA